MTTPTSTVDVNLYGQALLKNLYRFNENIIQGGNESSALSIRPHKELADLAQDWSGKRRKLILMPRGSFKSSVVTVGYAVQQICANPNIRILIGSEVNATAKKFLREIKDHFENNERLRVLYGDHVRKKSRWTDDEITSLKRKANLKDATVFTTGIDQSRTGSHCDLVILDDPVSATNISTPEAREKTLSWYREISNNILDPDGQLIVIGTRWHYSDLYQYIIDEESEEFDIHIREALLTDRAYKTLVSSIPVEEKERLIPDSQLLFPTRLGVRELWSKYKSVGSSMFSNQYLNRVMTDEDADFRTESIRIYDPHNPNDQYRLRTLNTYICVDPADSKAATADYTAILVAGVDEMNNWFVLDYEHEQGMKPQEMIDIVFRYNQIYRPRKIGIEVQGGRGGLMYSFRDEERKRQIRLPIEEIKRDNSQNKEMRIRGVLQPIVEQKRLFLQSGHRALLDELKMFPRSKHDDLLDALADCSQIMLGYRHGKSAEVTAPDKEKEWERNMAKQFPRRYSPKFTLTRSNFTNY